MKTKGLAGLPSPIVLNHRQAGVPWQLRPRRPAPPSGGADLGLALEEVGKHAKPALEALAAKIAVGTR